MRLTAAQYMMAAAMIDAGTVNLDDAPAPDAIVAAKFLLNENIVDLPDDTRALLSRIFRATARAESRVTVVEALLKEADCVLRYVARWAWRDSVISDQERLGSIKFHPTIRALANGAEQPAREKS